MHYYHRASSRYIIHPPFLTITHSIQRLLTWCGLNLVPFACHQEKLTTIDKISTLLIFIGATVSTTFGSHKAVRKSTCFLACHTCRLAWLGSLVWLIYGNGCTALQVTHDVHGFYNLYKREEFIIFQVLAVVRLTLPCSSLHFSTPLSVG